MKKSIITSKEKQQIEIAFHHLTQILPVGVYQTTPEGNCQYVNESWCNMAGLTSEEAMGAGWIQGIFIEDRELVFREWDKMVKSKGQWSLEYRFQNKEGKITWVQGRATPLLNDNNEIIGYIGTNTDITDRIFYEKMITESQQELKEAQSLGKIAAQTLQETKNNLQTLIDATKDAVLLIELDGTIKVCNKSMEKVFSKTINELIDTIAYNLVSQDVANLRKKHSQKVIESGITERFIDERNNRVIENTICPVFDENGKVVRLAIFGQDITESRKNEVELQKLMRAVEQSPVSIVITDVQGKINYVNPKFSEITGYSFKEAFGKNPNFLQSGLTPIENYKSLWKEITAGRVWRGEFCNKKKNNELFWELASISPVMNEYGEIINYVAVKEDITERKAVNEKILQQKIGLSILTAELIRAREIEQKKIAQELHDEIGQSLTAIKINLSEINRNLPDNKNNNLKNKVIETTDLSEKIIEQIHNISLNLRPPMLDHLGLIPTLRWKIDQFRKRLSIKIQFKEIEIPQFSHPDMPIMLFRIVQESLNNISKHANAKKVLVEFSQTTKILTLLIEDDGQGFDVNLMKNSIEKKHGLGLLGMQERASLIGGKLNIVSLQGKGTRISLEIPINTEIQNIHND